MNRANTNALWLDSDFQKILWGLRDNDYLDQESVNILRRIQKEIPAAIKRGKKNNAKSQLFRKVA